jgi:glycosyltransferase involved in cell wall biosynthesis
MRVLHLSADRLYGGVETMLLTLARHRDLCPEMLPAFGLCFTGRLSKELTESGAPPHPLGDVRISRYWSVLLARRRLERLLARVRPDVVVSHESWSHVVFAPVVRRHRLPLVFWAHSFRNARNWQQRWAGRTSPDLVVANSRATNATLGSLFPSARRAVVHCPVVARGPADPDANRRAIRAELDTPLDATVIAQACRLERWKGHTLLLSALARLAELPGWVAWIAGGAQRPLEQTYLAELRASAHRFGIADRVRFLGQRADVPNLLAAADIHCQPNTGPEPFGIAFIEALLAGLPVVTTALGAAPEIVDARCGVLVPPDDPAQLAEALRRLLTDPAERKRLGAGGPARGREMCDPASQLRKLADTLAETVRDVAERRATAR